MSEQLPKLKENYLIKGTIVIETGLTIGAGKDTLRIGGVDTPIMRDPVTGDPYIPGSSLKGKMRSLIELAIGKYEKDGKPHEICNAKDCPVCVVFGSLKNDNVMFGRLIVRDSFLDARTEEVKIETKTENVINRINGRAVAPRSTERVAPGTRFTLELIYSVFGHNNDKENMKTIFEALNLLQDSYLGSSGSRGYGKVKFIIKKIIRKTLKDYENGSPGIEILSDEKGLSPEKVLEKQPWL